ncbi:MAG: aspartyl protease family protein [Chloroflexi bacterium]|nr:aspartyl protease family protein [Chloroflexota bacterium]
MPTGHFDEGEAPRIGGRLSIPSLTISGHIDFLVDTGADNTVLFIDDGDRLGLPYNKLPPPTPGARGVGGPAAVSIVEATVSLWDIVQENGIDHFQEYPLSIRLLIMLHNEDEEKEKAMQGVASLLGRDVLNHWAISYDAPTNVLTFDNFRA